MSTVLVSTTSTGRLFHREGAATQNARLASSVRVLGTIRRPICLPRLLQCDHCARHNISPSAVGREPYMRQHDLCTKSQLHDQATFALHSDLDTPQSRWKLSDSFLYCCSSRVEPTASASLKPHPVMLQLTPIYNFCCFQWISSESADILRCNWPSLDILLAYCAPYVSLLLYVSHSCEMEACCDEAVTVTNSSSLLLYLCNVDALLCCRKCRENKFQKLVPVLLYITDTLRHFSIRCCKSFLSRQRNHSL